MILIKYVLNNDFEYDIQGLIRSFFPEEETVTNKLENEARLILECGFNYENLHMVLKENGNVIDEKKSFCAYDGNGEYDRKETKNILKRDLYDILSKYTNKTLLWGTLSGIRPTKITTNLLENNLSEEEVIDYVKKNYYISEKKAKIATEISKREIKIFNSFDYKNEYSLYIGIPFCPSTCLYCSFTSYSIAAFKDKVDDYLNALVLELKAVAEKRKGKKLSSVYIGGGTPTSITDKQLDFLLTNIEELFDLSSVKEFCVESGRPDSITMEKLIVMKNHGVSRISINPQTLKDETLKIIGRRHTVEDFYNAFEMARKAGFNNINTDFILGLPNENSEDVRNNMEKLLELKPESLTIHSLALKRAARLNMFKGDYAHLSFDNSDEIMDITHEYAGKMGLYPYYLYRQKNMKGNLENTGFAKDGMEGIYNMLIMEEKHDIIACGAGASTKLVKYTDDGMETQIKRIENVKNVDVYIDRIDEMIDRKGII